MVQKKIEFDIDIDTYGIDPGDYGVRGMMVHDGRVKKHPSAVYISTSMPIDPITGYASIDYKDAQEMGFIKVDLLSNTAYARFNTKQELLDNINKPPNWKILQNERVVSRLPQIGGHFRLVESVGPTSIEELADVLALIRPGKIDLLEEYLDDRILTRRKLYTKPKTGMYFKKSHAISYAIMLVAILNKVSTRDHVKLT